jgi:hypothetical protein
MEKAFLLFGPSGSGKSTVALEFENRYEFLKYETDRSDELNGIDVLQIRAQWDLFHDYGQSKPLHDVLIHRAKESKKKGTVLSLPSMIPYSGFMKNAAQEGLPSIILYGLAEECFNSFRQRERETGRNLPDEHWLVNNPRSYIVMGFDEYASFRIPVFFNGKRNLPRVVGEIIKRLG